jgi:hypothetical protein
MRIGLYDGVGMPSTMHKECSGSADAERKAGERDDARMGESVLHGVINDEMGPFEHEFLQLFNTDLYI